MARPALAEKLHSSHDYDVSREEYGKSVRIIRAIGQTADVNEVRLEFVRPHEEQGFEEFFTALTEMLGTTDEYGEQATVDRVRHYQKVDGKVRTPTGEAFVDVLQNGANKARETAEENPDMQDQVERDDCDVEIARGADALKPGTMLWGMSMAPRTALKKYPKTFKPLGYDEDLAYFQFYAASEQEMAAGSFSVTVKDIRVVREVLAEQGMVIPEDTSDNEWLKYAQTTIASAEQAEAFIKSLRHEIYERSGINTQRKSINEYTKGQEPKLRAIYATYYQQLSRAAVTGDNNTFLQEFAATILSKDIDDLDPKVQRQLVRIANATSFDDESTRTLNSVMLYAVAEELRKGLPEFFRQKQTGSYNLQIVPEQIVYYVQDPRIMHTMLAGNIQTGVAAGREYRGCPGQVKLGAKSSSLNETAGSNGSGEGGQQEAYGGKGGEDDTTDKKVMKCVNCPKCRTYHEELKPKEGKYTCKNKKCGYSVKA